MGNFERKQMQNMTSGNDPFIHHPELRDMIKNPLQSFFRDFDPIDALKKWPELHWVLEKLHSESYREKSRRETLEKHNDDDLWIFAYGSLMWDPAFEFSEVRRARVSDHARRFILKDVWGGRGTLEMPGLMAALDKGDGCEGLIYRLSGDKIEAETRNLWRREMIGPGYVPSVVHAVVDDSIMSALTFVADYEAETIHPDLPRQKQVEFITTGSGVLGTSVEYLENIVSQFSALGIVDEDCSTLLQEVQAHAKTRQSGLEGASL